MTSKDFLLMYRKCAEVIEFNRRELKRIEADLVSLPATDYSQTKVQTSTTADLGAQIIKLEEDRERIVNEITAQQQMQNEIIEVVKLVKDTDPKLALVIYRRYIDPYKMTWEDIAREMNYSVRALHGYIHPNALKEVTKARKELKKRESVHSIS